MVQSCIGGVESVATATQVWRYWKCRQVVVTAAMKRRKRDGGSRFCFRRPVVVKAKVLLSVLGPESVVEAWTVVMEAEASSREGGNLTAEAEESVEVEAEPQRLLCRAGKVKAGNEAVGLQCKQGKRRSVGICKFTAEP